MALDKEQRARLTFLTEAETYFGQIEAALLAIKTVDDRSSQVNIALRAAHSIKGTAGMMGFTALSQVAHKLEDSFKILWARQISVDTSLETLLLQGVDCLRAVRQHYYDGQPTQPQWLATHAEPIFEQLNQCLGELTPADEARLLSEEADENLDFIIFTTSVEDCLEEFEQRLPQLSGAALRQALIDTAQRLGEFGLMAQLESFVGLCQSVQQHCDLAEPEALAAIAANAIKIWRRSHSLVLLGRTERLPTHLEPLDGAEQDRASHSDLGQLQEQLATLTVPGEFSQSDSINIQPGKRLDEPVDLEVLQGQFAALPSEQPVLDKILEPAAPSHILETEGEPKALAPAPVTAEMATNVSLVPLSAPPQLEAPSSQQVSTVRVSVDQLKKINSTFEDLILNRNSVNLKLDQLDAFSKLMQERMVVLSSFNRELRQWYDQASTEGSRAPGTVSNNGQVVSNQAVENSAAMTGADALDVLELDRYSKLQLLAQEHMETIVKLEEVSRDIELGLNEIGQAISGFNYTSRALKTRITQTQMRPFEEIVSHFPRVVRDWSVQYNKPVELTIEGATTLLEQFALDQLSDPLMHLLRNAFDHGIERPEIRQAHQKPRVGTIALRAVNRGNRVVVTLSDDGGGIDLDQVRDRIRKYNLPNEQVDGMTPQELIPFIFEPGFSTTGQVTELSGRGVGMDVVRTNLKELQGDIQVHTNPGQGSTFTLSIPLSLSIVRVMVLERNGLVFALPVDTVQEVIRTSVIASGDPTMSWQDQSIPLIRLEEYWVVQCATRPLEIAGKPLINCPMVLVVGETEQCYGLTIDRFWQEQEVAIRPVVSPISMPPGFSGATVLGDGRVVPLVDPIRLMDWIHQRPDSSSAPPVAPSLPVQTKAARILVVDDSIHARRYLAASLERAGYLVEQAKDGRDAVDKLTNGLSVEAVICDIEMPRLDGYGVLEELREQSEFSQLPIVMLTSRSSEKHRKLAMNLGATDYFSKPYNEQELLKQLKLLIV
ncbi:MAG: hybrid sensor histidine kinase/response regulator [Cyanobacteria bacterium P01_H01_bin.26]